MAAALRFWFQVISMTWDEEFEQREENGEWRPPRPPGSNVLVGDDSELLWYEYNDGETTQVEEPDSEMMRHFKTFSFYFQNGFWIYPCNAIQYKVGDGSIHPPTSDSETDNGNSSSTDDQNESEDDNRLDDWKPLTFIWDINNIATSFGTIRAEHQVLQTQHPGHTWVQEVIPERYFAPQAQHTNSSGRGGLVGKIPILIALIAFSVQPDLVPNILTQCLRHSYNLHGQSRGLGWISQRGLVVRVFREKDTDEQEGQQHRPEESASFQRMRAFEYARFGFRNFFPEVELYH